MTTDATTNPTTALPVSIILVASPVKGCVEGVGSVVVVPLPPPVVLETLLLYVMLVGTVPLAKTPPTG